MSVEIIFETHSDSLDNEKDLASGWNDVELSDLGKQRAANLGQRRGNEHFDVIYCSDLARSYKTAEIAFGDKFPIIKDKRLRECDYGQLTQAPADQVKAEKPKRITEPFPGGESFQDTIARMRSFLEVLLRERDGQRVMIIGHRATQYGLENLILDKPIEEVVPAPWSWQPGWEYKLEK